MTFPERDAVAAANLEEISLPNELKKCSFQDEVSSIVTLKVSIPSKLLLSVTTEKLSTALSFGGYLSAIFLLLKTFLHLKPEKGTGNNPSQAEPPRIGSTTPSSPPRSEHLILLGVVVSINRLKDI